MLSPFAVTIKVVKVLEECGIPYLIGGSLGSSIYGVPRATMDADLVVKLEVKNIISLVDQLKDEFYIDSDMIKEALNQKACFNLIHLPTMFKVDLFVSKNTPFEQEEFLRRQTETLPETGAVLYFASPEDLILHKLLWYQEGGEVSERQWLDALNVYMVQSERLDHDYLRHWAAELEILALLEKLMTDSGKK
jgi:hypothetical protein